MNLRGKIVTVIDLGRKMGLAQSGVRADSRILIVSWKGEYVGLLVDGVGDVLCTDRTCIEPTPANVRDTQSRYLEGVCRDKGRLVGVLNLDVALADQ